MTEHFAAENPDGSAPAVGPCFDVVRLRARRTTSLPTRHSNVTAPRRMNAPVRGARTVKFRPFWRRLNFAEPAGTNPESPAGPMLRHSSSAWSKYCSSKRMNIASPAMPEPGIEPRMPTVSGCSSVSQMFTVAQSSGDLSTDGFLSCAPAGAAHAAAAAQSAKTEAARRPGTAPGERRGSAVMEAAKRRSAGMSETLTMALSPPNTATFSFDALYRESARDVHAYAWSLLRDQAAAEDVTAVAFERAYRRRKRFDPERGSARAWLFAIARNAALDELRHRKRTAALTFDPAAEPEPTAGEEPERRATVSAALATLDPRERELVALKFHGALSNAEIGSLLGISESNAGTRVHRAVTKLRKACA